MAAQQQEADAFARQLDQARLERKDLAHRRRRAIQRQKAENQAQYEEAERIVTVKEERKARRQIQQQSRRAKQTEEQRRAQQQADTEAHRQKRENESSTRPTNDIRI
jgi:hypothetical protein